MSEGRVLSEKENANLNGETNQVYSSTEEPAIVFEKGSSPFLGKIIRLSTRLESFSAMIHTRWIKRSLRSQGNFFFSGDRG